MKKLSFILIGAFAGTTLTLSAVFALGIAPHTFPDVKSGEFYSDAVTKASNEGWVTGYDNGNFGPNDTVTRAQLVTILDRYNQKIAQDTLNLRTVLCSNKDNASNNIKAQFESPEEKDNYEIAYKDFCTPKLLPTDSGCVTTFDPKTGAKDVSMCK